MARETVQRDKPRWRASAAVELTGVGRGFGIDYERRIKHVFASTVSDVNSKDCLRHGQAAAESQPVSILSRLTGSTIGFRGHSVETALAAIAAAGLGAADIGGLPGYCEHFDPAADASGQEAWQKTVQASGVQVCTLNVDIGGFNESGADREWLRHQARTTLQAAARVGAEGVTFSPGKPVDRAQRPLAAELKTIGSEFHALGDEAEALGLTLTFEAPHRNGLIQDAREARALAEACHHPHVGLVFDVGHHLRAGWTLADAWAVVGPWVHHVHLKDQAAGQGRYPLGAGAVDFARLFLLFQQAGYRGKFGLEFPDVAPACEPVIDVLIRSVAYLRDLVLPVEPG
jgi:sugar phosphate isomerase/epimerase